MFWIYYLNVAITAFNCSKEGHGRQLEDADFLQVLSNAPWLMDETLVDQYYSSGLLNDKMSAAFWRLPDLQSLVSPLQVIPRTVSRLVGRNEQRHNSSYARFAFAVVKKYLSSKHRRGWIIKHAMPALQSSIMRLRAANPSIAPFSETTACFWIQIIHAAFSPDTTAIRRWSFFTFSQRFHLRADAWMDYYSAKVWNSIAARVEFVPPDIKPLPSVLPCTHTFMSIASASDQRHEYLLGVVPELPSVEELSFYAALAVEEHKQAPPLHANGIRSHSQLIAYLHLHSRELRSIANRTRSPQALLETLKATHVTSRTQQLFWINAFLSAGLSDKADSKLPKPKTRPQLATELPILHVWRCPDHSLCDCGKRRRSLGDSPLHLEDKKADLKIEKRDSKIEKKDSLPVVEFGDFVRANPWLLHEELWAVYYSPEIWDGEEAAVALVKSDRRKMRWLFDVDASPVVVDTSPLIAEANPVVSDDEKTLNESEQTEGELSKDDEKPDDEWVVLE